MAPRIKIDSKLTYFEADFNLFPLIPACTARPGLPLSPPEIAFLESLYYRPRSPIAITQKLSFSHLHTKRWRCKPDTTMITNNFCACGLFKVEYPAEKSFVFVEFWTTFFRVSTCFNGSAAAMDAQLGFGTRLRWFCDRGVWWKRTFCGKFGSGNDVDWLLLLLDWVFRCQQWFEWRSQRFYCDAPDSNDSLTSRRRLIYVNLCFHLYLPSH